MSDMTSQIREHMDVIASCGRRVGEIDRVEGRSLKLTGSAEEQYRQWREMLRDYQAEEAVRDDGDP